MGSEDGMQRSLKMAERCRGRGEYILCPVENGQIVRLGKQCPFGFGPVGGSARSRDLGICLVVERRGHPRDTTQTTSLGVRIAIDDFGTGHSSLNYLRSFPFDSIKIDRSFIHDLSSKKDSRAIVRAVAQLASSLRMETTAEGVETQAELDYLKRLGCTQAQGYFFSEARPANDVLAWLASRAKQPKTVVM
jgi:hypothetical protein